MFAVPSKALVHCLHDNMADPPPDGASSKKRKAHSLESKAHDGTNKRSKLVRREEKRSRRRDLATGTAHVPESSAGAHRQDVSLNDSAKKAAKKAEKLRAKALKKDKGVQLDLDIANISAPAVTADNTQRSKDERKSAKVARRANEAGHRIMTGEGTIGTANEAASMAEGHSGGSKARRDIAASSGNSQPESGANQAVTTEIRRTEKGQSKSSEILNGTLTQPKNMNRPRSTSSTMPDYQEDSALTALPQSEIDAFLASNFITITDPSSSSLLRPITSFSHLPDSVLTEPSPFTTFKNPTPIQSAAWPFLLSGRDVIGVAETGSGKTLAFGVPCVRYITSLFPTKKGGRARAVIVSPTRELAVQIHDQILQLATPAGLNTVCVYGGVPKDAQRQALRTAHIIVATPGRLNDLINEGAADLSNVGYVVLDEADRMLDKGFEEEIRKIISTTSSPDSFEKGNRGRQTLMFTATWPPSVRDLASTFMRSPVKIAIGDNPTGELRANTSITQKVEVISPYDKETRLVQLLKQHSSTSSHTRILVFCLYKKEASRVEGFLRSKGLKVAGIHGDLSQEKRTAALEAFKRDKGTPILVATDVAARGLDIPAVKLVINMTFPLTVEDYVHRIGR